MLGLLIETLMTLGLFKLSEEVTAEMVSSVAVADRPMNGTSGNSARNSPNLP